MTSTKFDVEKFTGQNDFGLWKVRMESLLAQQGLEDVLVEEKGKLEGELKDQRKKMSNKAKGAIFLCLGDKVLREVAKEETALAVWTKLESLYQTKSVANRLYLKQRLYTYKFSEDRSAIEQLDEFNKAIDDLECIGVKVDKEDRAIHLLNALPASYDNLKKAMIYGRESTISLEEVQTAIKSEEIQKNSEGKRITEDMGLAIKAKWSKNFKKQPTKKVTFNLTIFL